jgi:hypothetical protein
VGRDRTCGAPIIKPNPNEFPFEILALFENKNHR